MQVKLHVKARLGTKRVHIQTIVSTLKKDTQLSWPSYYVRIEADKLTI